MTNEATYQQGAQAARDKLGEECNEYTAACWGLAAVFQAAGHNVEIMEVANRWHYPLAGANEQSTFGHWAKMLESAGIGRDDPKNAPFEIRDVLEGRVDYWWRFHKAQEACDTAASQAVIEKQAVEFIDREIKRKYPDCRRKTKRYRELAASVETQARAIITEELREKAGAKLEELQTWLAREESKMRRIVGDHTASLLARAADLRALNAESQAAAAMQAFADRIAARLAERSEAYASSIADMVATLAAPAPEGDLPKAYRDAKAAVPECICLFKGAEHVSAVGPDAAIVADVFTFDLEEGTSFPVCKAPIGQLDYVLNVLVKRGHRVAVCEGVTA